MSRTTMANLISTVRQMAHVGTATYTIDSTSYWTDDQLQTVLDRYVTVIRDEYLNPISEITTGGTVIYKDYQSQSRFFEATNAGTAQFVIREAVGGTIQGTASWSANYETGLISFAADTQGTAYVLSGRSYDVYAAAADVCYQVASDLAFSIDFTTAGHSVKRSHITDNYLKIAKKYEAMATSSINSSSVTMVRGDENNHGYYHMEHDND